MESPHPVSLPKEKFTSFDVIGKLYDNGDFRYRITGVLDRGATVVLAFDEGDECILLPHEVMNMLSESTLVE